MDFTNNIESLVKLVASQYLVDEDLIKDVADGELTTAEAEEQAIIMAAEDIREYLLKFIN